MNEIQHVVRDGLSFLNSTDANSWDRMLYKIINLQPSIWEIHFSKFVAFVKILSNNWSSSIPQLLEQLDEHEIDIDSFFKLERNVSFKLASLLGDINVLQKEILSKGVDVSPFISKLSHAFLPSVVYQLEEYGLPRMISKKIHNIGVVNFLDDQLTLHKTIDIFNKLDRENFFLDSSFDEFDRYILEYFYDGITLDRNDLAAA